MRLTVRGELDVATTSAFEQQLSRLSGSHPVIQLDLSALEFVDLAGLHSLERLIANGRSEGWLRVEPHVKPQVRRMLELTHTQGLLCPT